jgi:hypothetical protein
MGCNKKALQISLKGFLSGSYRVRTHLYISLIFNNLQIKINPKYTFKCHQVDQYKYVTLQVKVFFPNLFFTKKLKYRLGYCRSCQYFIYFFY